MSYLAVKGLHKRYGANTLFTDIEFHAEQGELVTLLGPSGCGKSTLLRCLAGLTEVDRGAIVLAGQDITHLPPQRRGIAMVFQSYALFPNMTVAQNVAFGLRMQRLARDEIEQRVREALTLVELQGFAERYPHQLSDGQCQHADLAVGGVR